MVIATLWIDRARAEGRQEGREDANQAWAAWNQRRLAAERDGQPFTEPPPSTHGADNDETS